jgi:hypothetical protein
MERYPMLLPVKGNILVSVAFLVLVLPVNVEQPLDDFSVFDGRFDDFVHIGNPDVAVEEFVGTEVEPIGGNADERTLLAKALATALGESEKIFAAVGFAVFVAKQDFDIETGFFSFLLEGVKDIECPIGNTTRTGTDDDTAVCPFHGVLKLVGTTLEKFFGNCHEQEKKGKEPPLSLF